MLKKAIHATTTRMVTSRGLKNWWKKSLHRTTPQGMKFALRVKVAVEVFRTDVLTIMASVMRVAVRANYPPIV